MKKIVDLNFKRHLRKMIVHKLNKYEFLYHELVTFDMCEM